MSFRDRMAAAKAGAESWRQDAWFGMRALGKSPGFALTAVGMLALGIGANATVFTIANGFLLRDLPFADSERILYITGVNKEDEGGRGESYPDYEYFRSQAKSFQALGAFSRFDADVSDAVSLPMQYKAARLTVNAFSAIGQRPVLGRDFLPEDARPGAQPVVILSYELWRNRYNEARSVAGSTIRINEVATVVIGVMAPGMRFPGDSRLWIPVAPAGEWTRREYRALTMFGRLAPGATPGSARAEMAGLAGRLEREFPASNRGVGVVVERFNDYFIGGDTRLAVLALLGAVGFVLLIACANVVNLLLSRAAPRAREVSIRVALGASPWRVIRQLLVESVMLAGAGGVVGLALGTWGVSAFQKTILADERAAALSFPVDLRVIGYLAAITLGAGILAGLAPALRLARLDVDAALREGGLGSSGGRRGQRLTAALVTFEMALAFLLLAGAGLMIRSFLKMARTPVGARTDHVMSMDVLLRASRYPGQAQEAEFYRQLLERVRRLPGVEEVGMASNLPGDGWTDFRYEIEGAAPVEARQRPQTGGLIVSAGYFPLLGVRPVRGRALVDSDGANGFAVAMVNESFAKRAWPGQDPIGKRLRVEARDTASPAAAAAPWLTVVGVAPDIVQSDESQGLRDPLVYLPYREMPQREMVVAARTAAPPEYLAHDFRRAVQSIDGDMPVTDLRSLDQLLWERTWKWRVYGGMFSIFAAMALMLASVGLYSVAAQTTNGRIREIGIRMALGARRGDIVWMIIGGGLRRMGVGLAVGLGAALEGTRVLGALLVGVRPNDPATLEVAAMVLGLAGALGAAIPALRASRVDAAAVLRHE